MLSRKEGVNQALCQALSLDLLGPDQGLTRLLPGDILDIHCDGFVKVVRGGDNLKFDLGIEKEEENLVYYLGCRIDAQMVGFVKLLSALMGISLKVLEAGKRQCRFLVSAKD